MNAKEWLECTKEHFIFKKLSSTPLRHWFIAALPRCVAPATQLIFPATFNFRENHACYYCDEFTIVTTMT